MARLPHKLPSTSVVSQVPRGFFLLAGISHLRHLPILPINSGTRLLGVGAVVADDRDLMYSSQGADLDDPLPISKLPTVESESLLGSTEE